MAVRRGQAWGTQGALGPDGVVVGSDAEARRVVERARRAGEPVPDLGLLGGDLCRTVGGSGDAARLRSPEAARLPVDVGAVLLDGRPSWFVAHLVARRSWWWGPVLAAMNAQFVGRWDVAPRSHPGDGRLDVLEARLGPRDRLRARSRLPGGTHVPHPGISERRLSSWEVSFDRPVRVWLDGELVGPARAISVRVEPEALTVVV